jgi:hypothetical protein
MKPSEKLQISIALAGLQGVFSSILVAIGIAIIILGITMFSTSISVALIVLGGAVIIWGIYDHYQASKKLKKL